MKPVYTVYKCKSKTDDTRKGYIHFADTDKVTRCGKSIDENWYILTNDHNGDATCPKCLKNCEIISKPLEENCIDLFRSTIKKHNPNFTNEQIEASMDAMFNKMEKLLSENNNE